MSSSGVCCRQLSASGDITHLFLPARQVRRCIWNPSSASGAAAWARARRSWCAAWRGFIVTPKGRGAGRCAAGGVRVQPRIGVDPCAVVGADIGLPTNRNNCLSFLLVLVVIAIVVVVAFVFLRPAAPPSPTPRPPPLATEVRIETKVVEVEKIVERVVYRQGPVTQRKEYGDPAWTNNHEFSKFVRVFGRSLGKRLPSGAYDRIKLAEKATLAPATVEALLEGGNPTLQTLWKVCQARGIRLSSVLRATEDDLDGP